MENRRLNRVNCSFFRAARLDLADSRRAINSERRETLLLLKDAAQRHMRIEASKSGKDIGHPGPKFYLSFFVRTRD